MATKPTQANGAMQKFQGQAAVIRIKETLEKCREQIRMALPKHLTPERMIRIAFSAVQRNSKLMEADPISIAKAVIEASELGLEPSGILGLAYLVPYRNKRGGWDAQLQIGYRGYIELASRSARVRSITAVVVYDCDQFVYVEGKDPILRHVPTLNRPEAAKPIAAYAVAQYADGGTAHQVLDLNDIKRRQEASKRQGDDSPWVTHWDEMAKKSAIRALAKYLPLSPELTTAAVREEYREEGIDVEGVVLTEATAEDKKEPEAEKKAADPEEPKTLEAHLAGDA